jgi:hypothetical protein
MIITNILQNSGGALLTLCECSKCRGAVHQRSRTARAHVEQDIARSAARGVPTLHPASAEPSNSHDYQEPGPSTPRAHAPLPERSSSPHQDYTNMEAENFRRSPSAPIRLLSSPARTPPSSIVTPSPRQSPHRLSAQLHPPSPSPSVPESPPEYLNLPRARDNNDMTNRYFDDLLGARWYAEDQGLHRAMDQLPHIDLDDESQLGSDYDENFGIPPDEEEELAPPLPNHQAPQAPEQPDADADADPNDNVFNAEIPALEEPPVIRNIYISALAQRCLHHATHEAVKDFLSSFDESLSANPTVDPSDCGHMARTLATVERRLGLSTKDLITMFTLCARCSKRYTPEYIDSAFDPRCTTEGCHGVLFQEKTLASGARKRISYKTYPYASITGWLKRMLLRDGHPELMQAWREPEDMDVAQPITRQEWYNHQNLNDPLGDIYDGWGWRARTAGLYRLLNPETGEVSDETDIDPPIRFSSLPFGLSLSMNVDW